MRENGLIHELKLEELLQPVGTLTETWIYPVKSMVGMKMDETVVDFYGLAGDRRRAFSIVGSKANNARAFLTARDRGVNDLLVYRPYFVDPANPNTSEVRVITPSGQDVGFESDELKAELEEKSGKLLDRRIYKGGFPDNHRISIIGMTSIDRLSKEIGADVDHRRFRANFYIHFLSEIFLEEQQQGILLQIGKGDSAPRIMIQRNDDRCMMVNLDPNSAEVNPQILKQIAQHHNNTIGVYGEVLRPGIVKAGDEVRILELS